jgi:ribA/ribD-fused uncharacterized protein
MPQQEEDHTMKILYEPLIQADNAIDHFSGQYGFLSNFSLSPIRVPGWQHLVVPTAEHVFQMAKTFKKEAEWIAAAPGASEAKERGQAVEVHPRWETSKRRVMLNVLLWKFAQNDDLAQKLRDTGTRPLVEGNTRGDTYWGAVAHTSDEGLPLWVVRPGVSLAGHNWLGRCLMMVREVL